MGRSCRPNGRHRNAQRYSGKNSLIKSTINWKGVELWNFVKYLLRMHVGQYSLRMVTNISQFQWF